MLFSSSIFAKIHGTVRHYLQSDARGVHGCPGKGGRERNKRTDRKSPTGATAQKSTNWSKQLGTKGKVTPTRPTHLLEPPGQIVSISRQFGFPDVQTDQFDQIGREFDLNMRNFCLHPELGQQHQLLQIVVVVLVETIHHKVSLDLGETGGEVI